MRGIRFRIVLLSLALLSFSNLTLAARNGYVREANTELHEAPDLKSKVLDKLPAKAEVVASNLPVEGFYKVRLNSGVVGWVSESALELQSPPPPEEVTKAMPEDSVEGKKRRQDEQALAKKAATPALADHTVQLSGLGGWNLFTAAGIVSGYDGISQGLSYGGELQIFLSQKLALSFRGEYLFKTVNLSDTTTGKLFQLELNSIPIMGGFDFAFVKGPRASLHLAGYGGYALQTNLRSTNLTDAPPPDAVTQVNSNHITALGKLALQWHFFRWLSVFAEGGYRYLQSPTMAVPSNNNGALILNPSFTVNLSGFFFGAGLGLSL